MFGPFSAGDSLRVYRLQRKGVFLDLPRALTQPSTPLWEAWLAYLSQQAMGSPTFVLDDLHDGEGIIQVRYRPHQAAADVTFLAPALTAGGRAAHTWARLLEGASTEAAGRGIQRIFASVPDQGAEVEIFHQAGFAPYSSEAIYRRAADLGDGSPPPDLPGLRPRRPEDWPALQKLCVAITPQRVRQAEGGITLSLGRERRCRWYVLPGEGDRDLIAALSLCAGKQAHWLRLLLHPEAPLEADDLIRWGLAALAQAGGRPVYCHTRQYEGGLRPALEATGFTPDQVRTLMVKQTVALAKAPVPDRVPALAASEVAPPVYHLQKQN